MKTFNKYITGLLAAALLAPVTLSAQGTNSNFVNPDAIKASKKVIPYADNRNKYTIEIEAFVTGKTIHSEQIITKPVDIALALDYSSSMVTTSFDTYTALKRAYAYSNTSIKAPSKNVTKPYYYYLNGQYYEVIPTEVNIGGTESTAYYLYWKKSDRENKYLDGASADKNAYPTITDPTANIYTGGKIYTKEGDKYVKSTKTTLSYNDVANSGTTYYVNLGGDPDAGESYYYVLTIPDGAQNERTKYLDTEGLHDRAYTNITGQDQTIYSGVLYTAAGNTLYVMNGGKDKNKFAAHSSTNPDEVFYTGKVYTVSGQGPQVKYTVVDDKGGTYSWNDLYENNYYYCSKNEGNKNAEYKKFELSTSSNYEALPDADYSYETIANSTVTYYYKKDKDYKPVSAQQIKNEAGNVPDFKEIKAGSSTTTTGGTKGFGLKFVAGGTTYYLTNDASGNPTITTTPTGVATQDATVYTGPLYGQTRLTALQAAMAGFIDIVYEKTIAGGDILLGVVTFDMDATIYQYNRVNYIKVDSPEKVAALKDLIYFTVPDTGTNHPDAMDKSHTVLQSMKNADKDRDAVQDVILFTDGETYTGTNTSAGKKRDGNSAVAKAYDYFKAEDTDTPANVYCISLLDQTTLNTYPWVSDLVQVITSEWPEATGLPDKSANDPKYNEITPVNADENTGGRVYGGSQYYYPVYDGSTVDLSDVFTEIARQTTDDAKADIKLDGNSTTVIDAMSDSFRLPVEMVESDVTLKVANVTGKSGNDYTFGTSVNAPESVGVTIDKENKKLTVTGYDFSANFVGPILNEQEEITGYTGQKLIISFDIEIDPENPGGANVVTNDLSSGIYADGKKVYELEQPYAKIPNLIIQKTGLHAGESAIFTITPESFDFVDANNYAANKKPIEVVVTCTEEGKPATAYVKVQFPGRYTVTESDWSWAYTLSTIKGVSASTSGNDTDTGKSDAEWTAKDKAYYDLTTYAKPEDTTYVIDMAKHSLTRNVNFFTQDSTLSGTVYDFGNVAEGSATKPVPPHAESYEVNAFKTVGK